MIEASTTALVLIDLQKGIVSMPVGPRSGQDVVANSVKLLGRCRELGAYVVLVHVAFSADGKDILRPNADQKPQVADRPADWAEFVPEIQPQNGELVVTKHQWGAFHGTELDLQLRRRGIRSIILAGISTNFGVESTARFAFELGYDLVFAEDAMAGPSAEAHRFPIENIFPRIGRVRSTDEILAELQ